MASCIKNIPTKN